VDEVVYPENSKVTKYHFGFQPEWVGSIAGSCSRVEYIHAPSGKFLFVYTDVATYSIPLEHAKIKSSTWRSWYAYMQIQIGEDIMSFQYEQYDEKNRTLFDPADIKKIRELSNVLDSEEIR